MAIHTPRETVGLLLASVRKKRETRKPGRRNYMKKQMQGIPADDPAYLELLRSAGNKKAPFAEKTKGYYRFSREFPDTVDAQGYRVNGKQKEKPPKQSTLIVFAVFAIVLFSVAYTMTNTVLEISDAPPQPTTVAPSTEEVTEPTEENTTVEGESQTLTEPQPSDTSDQESVSEEATQTDISIPSDPAVSEESSVLVSAEPTEPIPENSSIVDLAPTEDGRQPDLQGGWN